MAIIIETGMCIVSLASYDTGRIHNTMGALVGIIYIYIFCNSNIFTRDNCIKIVLTIILGIYTIIVMANTFNLISQHKIVNNLEKEQCEGLEEYIREYEQENNMIVTEVRYFKRGNKDENGYFESVTNKSVLTYNGVACTWSSIGTINFYTNRNFKNENVQMINDIELLKTYLKIKNEGFDNNFIIIDGILYYSVFI